MTRFSQWLARLASVLLVIGSTGACKPKKTSTISAIVSFNGKNAFGLILMRNFYDPGRGILYEDDALMVENALRLQLALIECRGEGAADRVNFLETLAFNNPDLVRRDGDQVVAMTPDSVEPMKGCSVVGKHIMGPASFVETFENEPQDEATFKAQQTVWLAIRGRANLATKTFGVQFYNWLGENLGALPRKSFADVAGAIEQLDALYNPCMKHGLTASKFKKRQFYFCDERSNYQVKGDYKAVRDAVSSKIDKIEGEFLASLELLRGDDLDRVAGLDVAWTVSKTIAKDLKLSGKSRSATTAPLEADDGVGVLPKFPVIRKLDRKSRSFEDIFRIQIGRQPTPVFSFSNPRAVDTPPDAPEQSEAMALAQSGPALAQDAINSGFNLRGRKWRRSRNRPNYYHAYEGTYQGRPVYTSQSVAYTSTQRQQTTQSQWVYLGPAQDGTHKWKRPNDSAIYYADARGNVTRTTSNTTPGTGGRTSFGSTNSSAGTSSGNASQSGKDDTGGREGSSGWNTLLKGGYTNATGTGSNETKTQGSSSDTSRTGTSGTDSPDRKGATSTSAQKDPSVQTNDDRRDHYRENLEWGKEQLGGMEASQYITQNGKTLPNFERFTSGAAQVPYTYGQKAKDGANYTGHRFNCQDFTASDIQGYYELTGIKAKAVHVQYKGQNPKMNPDYITQQYRAQADPNFRPDTSIPQYVDASGRPTNDADLADRADVGHSVGLYPVGRDAQGRDLYAFKEAQHGESGTKSEPFAWDGKDKAALGKQYADWSGKQGVAVHAEKTYDPKVGATSTIYSEKSSREEAFAQATRVESDGSKLYANAKKGEEQIAWPAFVPDPKPAPSEIDRVVAARAELSATAAKGVPGAGSAPSGSSDAPTAPEVESDVGGPSPGSGTSAFPGNAYDTAGGLGGGPNDQANGGTFDGNSAATNGMTTAGDMPSTTFVTDMGPIGGTSHTSIDTGRLYEAPTYAYNDTVSTGDDFESPSTDGASGAHGAQDTYSQPSSDMSGMALKDEGEAVDPTPGDGK